MFCCEVLAGYSLGLHKAFHLLMPDKTSSAWLFGKVANLGTRRDSENCAHQVKDISSHVFIYHKVELKAHLVALIMGGNTGIVKMALPRIEPMHGELTILHNNLQFQCAVMVNGLLARISLTCKEYFTQHLLDVLTSLCCISGDGQEQPAGLHLQHGARNGGGRREQGPFPPSTTCSKTDEIMSRGAGNSVQLHVIRLHQLGKKCTVWDLNPRPQAMDSTGREKDITS
ncbi:hypothetical protein B0H16DRAFT_1460947 [Mycena metata]|uniref:Uncharacterized protein n=1 Tax=Mycena metata TaxID=1033252 RepID=A0AAD7IT99_9AGAR|nr:hypothetical protein B0H16DRAFT_1460947 [Mycena metata]